MSSDRRFKPIGQGLFKGTDGIWKLPNGDIGAAVPAPVVDLGPAGPVWSRGFIVLTAANTSWWRIASGLGSSGRGNFMLTISGGGGGFTPSVSTYLISKSWQSHANDVGITLLNRSPQGGDHTAIRVDRDANGSYLDVQINVGASGGSMSYTIQDSNASPAATRKWLALATPEESPATTATSTFDLTQFSRSHNDIVFGVFSQGMDFNADEGGFFIGGDSTGDGLVELAGNQMKLRFNPAGAATVDIYHDGGSLIFQGSDTTEAFRFFDSSGLNRFLFQVSTTDSSNLLDLKRGSIMRIFNSDNADWITMSHDGTDFRLQDGGGTADFRITGMHVALEQDSSKFYWGASKDISMNWSGSNFDMKNEVNTSGYFRFLNTSSASMFQFEFSPTATSNMLEIRGGARLAIQDSTNADYVRIRHSGTDLLFESLNTDHYTFDKGIRASKELRITDYVRFIDSELTISGGVVTATKTRHKIDTQSDASTDDLDTINGGQDNQLLILGAASSARTVVVTQAGNLSLEASGPFSLTHMQDTIMLMYDSSLGKWVELSRSDNQT